LDTNPSTNPESDLPVDKTFGSPNAGCSSTGGPGEGAGGVESNCVGLGKVLILQQSNLPEAIAYTGGGDILFEFEDGKTSVLKLTLFNLLEGGFVIFEFDDGRTPEETEIPAMGENEVQSFDFDAEGVVKMTARFTGLGAIAGLGVCRDPRTTPAPVSAFNAPPSETGEPTPSPTISPAPSPAPSVPIPHGDCPADIELLDNVGETVYPQIPIEIVNQNKESVTFRVFNTFVDTVSSVYTQFHELSSGDTECFEDTNVERADYKEYTAYCMRHVPISIVDIWVVDDSFVNGTDDAEVPICCHPPDNHVTPTVQYTFKLRCVTECPEPTSAPVDDNVPARRLSSTDQVSHEHLMESLQKAKEASAGSSPAALHEELAKKERNVARDGHFCSSEDYPCEDDGNVYVCHYSSKDGYQTFCVSEPDSDILEFYPKDYCGPCVGGYSEIN